MRHILSHRQTRTLGKTSFDRVRICQGFELQVQPLDDPAASNTRWHKMAIEGKWSGHWMGPFSLTPPMFEQMVQAFGAQKIETVVDYEHASVFGGEAPAAGWIEDLQVRQGEQGAELWGRVNWTAPAAEQIRLRQYRYLSPTVVFNTRDRKTSEMTGASLHSVALTNKPFLTELPEVRLNAALLGLPLDEEHDAMNEEQLRALAAALGLSAEATPEQVTEKAQALKAQADQTAHAGETLAALFTRLELPQAATREQALAAVVQLKNPAGTVPADRVAALESELATLQRDRLIAAAEQAGKVTAQNREWAQSYALKDPEGFKAWMASALAIVPTRRVQPAPTNGAPTLTLNETEEHVRQKLGISLEQWTRYNVTDEEVAQ
jgi:phage I-like protein